jgi:hypothetical protein
MILKTMGFLTLRHELHAFFRWEMTVKATETTPEVVYTQLFDDATFWVYYHTLSTPGVWLFTFLLIIVALIPDVVLRTFKKHYLALRIGLQVGVQSPNS